MERLLQEIPESLSRSGYHPNQTPVVRISPIPCLFDIENVGVEPDVSLLNMVYVLSERSTHGPQRTAT